MNRVQFWGIVWGVLAVFNSGRGESLLDDVINATLTEDDTLLLEYIIGEQQGVMYSDLDLRSSKDKAIFRQWMYLNRSLSGEITSMVGHGPAGSLLPLSPARERAFSDFLAKSPNERGILFMCAGGNPAVMDGAPAQRIARRSRKNLIAVGGTEVALTGTNNRKVTINIIGDPDKTFVGIAEFGNLPGGRNYQVVENIEKVFPSAEQVAVRNVTKPSSFQSLSVGKSQVGPDERVVQCLPRGGRQPSSLVPSKAPLPEAGKVFGKAASVYGIISAPKQIERNARAVAQTNTHGINPTVISALEVGLNNASFGMFPTTEEFNRPKKKAFTRPKWAGLRQELTDVFHYLGDVKDAIREDLESTASWWSEVFESDTPEEGPVTMPSGSYRTGGDRRYYYGEEAYSYDSE